MSPRPSGLKGTCKFSWPKRPRGWTPPPSPFEPSPVSARSPSCREAASPSPVLPLPPSLGGPPKVSVCIPPAQAFLPVGAHLLTLHSLVHVTLGGRRVSPLCQSYDQPSPTLLGTLVGLALTCPWPRCWLLPSPPTQVLTWPEISSLNLSFLFLTPCRLCSVFQSHLPSSLWTFHLSHVPKTELTAPTRPNTRSSPHPSSSDLSQESRFVATSTERFMPVTEQSPDLAGLTFGGEAASNTGGRSI